MSYCPVCGDRFGQWSHLPHNGKIEWTAMYRVDSICVNRDVGEVGRVYAHGEEL